MIYIDFIIKFFRLSIPEMQDNKILLVIYNLRGQAVRKLLDGNFLPGKYSVSWDGTDDNGTLITSGYYFCVLKASNERLVRRFVLLK